MVNMQLNLHHEWITEGHASDFITEPIKLLFLRIVIVFNDWNLYRTLLEISKEWPLLYTSIHIWQ